MAKQLFWTKELCLAEAKKYKTKKEWRENNTSSLHRAYVEGWVNECCKHMQKIYKYYTFSDCLKIACKFNTRWEWSVKHAASYMKAYRSKWLDKCCHHMQQPWQRKE